MVNFLHVRYLPVFSNIFGWNKYTKKKKVLHIIIYTITIIISIKHINLYITIHRMIRIYSFIDIIITYLYNRHLCQYDTYINSFPNVSNIM